MIEIKSRFSGQVLVTVDSLRGADLREADLRGADLCEANLSGADLYGVNLREAHLRRASFVGADLRKTVLDPDAHPNTPTDWPETDGEYAIGYRTRNAGHIDKYRDGRFYSADWFSVCPYTECHPGLYLCPTIGEVRRSAMRNEELIRVRTKLSEIHQTAIKYRCRWFEVLGSVEVK